MREPVASGVINGSVFVRGASVREVAAVMDGAEGLLAPFVPGGEFRVMLSYWDGRWRRARDISNAVGRTRLEAAFENFALGPGRGLSLVGWSTLDHPAGDPVRQHTARQVWASVDAAGDALEVGLSVKEPDPRVVTGFLAGLVSRFEVVSGGAWGVPVGERGPVCATQVWPMWAAREGREWPEWAAGVWPVWLLEAPRVVGPMWKVVVPAEAHRVLVASDARGMAAGVREVVVDSVLRGAVWELTVDELGPRGDELARWVNVFEVLGVASGLPSLLRGGR